MGTGPRYNNWNTKVKYLHSEFVNSSKLSFPTNFSQIEQTDFVLINKSSIIKPKFANIIETNISDHYLVLADFY